MAHSRISESWLFLLSMVPGEYSTYSCSLAGKKKQERTLAWGKNRCLKQAADGKRRAQELAMPRLAAIKGVKTGGKPIRVVRRVRRLRFFFFTVFVWDHKRQKLLGGARTSSAAVSSGVKIVTAQTP